MLEKEYYSMLKYNRGIIVSLIFLLSIFNISLKAQNFYNDFERDYALTVWKHNLRVFDSLAFNGNFVCRCPENLEYAFGIDFNVDDSLKNHNLLFSFEMMLRSVNNPDALFVVSIKKDKKNVFWRSFPLSQGYVAENLWYNNSFDVLIPRDVLKDSWINCYIWNPYHNDFFIDDFKLLLEKIEIPTYLPKIKDVRYPNYLESLISESSLNLLYSKKENKIVFTDNNYRILTKSLFMYYSIIVNNDTIDIQSNNWKLLTVKNDVDQKIIKLKNINALVITELQVDYQDDNANVKIFLKTKFKKNAKIVRTSLIIPFRDNDYILYRKNLNLDSVDYQNVYYLDQEGFSIIYEDKQLNLYHPERLSSIQFDAKNSMAYLNMDYYCDHPLIRYPLLYDTIDYYVDKSTRDVKKYSELTALFFISMTDRTDLPRIMPIMDGYESAFIWTEHADWTDIKTHRAAYFGNEDIIDADSAVGGFVYYDIPVTKSVFYNNSDSVVNENINREFPGLQSTIMTDDLFFDFLRQLKLKGFDICLHTPEQYSSNQNNLTKALSFMKNNFGSPSWIDHGYNNGRLNNREDMVCDGLDSKSPYYVEKLWFENGVHYPWNATYEDMRPFENWLFDNNLLRPYPGFGDAFPIPKVMTLPYQSKLLLWYTSCTVEPGEDWAWDYYFSQDILDKIVDFRNVFIAHCYPAWVTTSRGFWYKKNDKIVAKEGFNRALERIAILKKQHLMLPTTVANYMHYQEQLKSLEYRVNRDGSLTLTNNNTEIIKGLSLISTKPIIIEGYKSYQTRKSKSSNEWIVWFDLYPDEKITIKH